GAEGVAPGVMEREGQGGEVRRGAEAGGPGRGGGGPASLIDADEPAHAGRSEEGERVGVADPLSDEGELEPVGCRALPHRNGREQSESRESQSFHGQTWG